MNNLSIQWHAPSPLWEEALKDGADYTRFKQPAILRFSSDKFMEELEQILISDPSQLKNYVAQPETWENESVGWLSKQDLLNENKPLTLFQPPHGRFYLVTSSLICKKPGFPDRTIQLDKEEKVSFVIRRMVPETVNAQTTEYEYAWNKDSGWIKASSPQSLMQNEERFPMFMLNFQCKRQKCQRKLLAGFIPVAGRETFQAPSNLNPMMMTTAERNAAKAAPSPDIDPLADPRVALFQTTVTQASQSLKNGLGNAEAHLKIEDARNILLFICLDLADFLRKYFLDVWNAIEANAWTGPNGSQKNLFDWFNNTKFYLSSTKYWDEALRDIYDQKENIYAGAGEEPMPGVTLITDTLLSQDIIAVCDSGILPGGLLETRVNAALGDYDQTMDQDAMPQLPKYEPGVYFKIRCVYERTRCSEMIDPVVSSPTREFQMASFFEPQAPARPIRIMLPADTGIAALRKFKKNVAIIVSNKLRKQMERMNGVNMGNLDDGKIPQEPGYELGMICSLSIPIITICAFILLMIILSLLNIIFWWIPFFKICFPILKKK